MRTKESQRIYANSNESLESYDEDIDEDFWRKEEEDE